MKNLLIRNFVRPLFERLGTASAVVLVSNGFDGELVNQFVAALAGAALIAIDLLLSKHNRKVTSQEAD